MAVLALVSCKAVTTKLEHLHDTSPFRGTNEQFQYAGYELHWQNVNDEKSAKNDEFAREFEEHFADIISRRMPKILKGERPVKLMVTVLDFSNPSALEKLLFQNPKIDYSFKFVDASSGEELLSVDRKLTDYRPDTNLPPPSGTGASASISFRIGSNASRLAMSAASDIVGVIRNYKE